MTGEHVKITIYGSGDDLVQVDGCEGADEFYVGEDTGSDSLPGTVWRGDFTGPDVLEQIRVYAIYDGCWHLSLGQVNEDVQLAPWPIRFRQGLQPTESEYSVVLEIDAPAGTRLTNIHPDPKRS